MNEIGIEYVDKIVNGAERIGALSAPAIMAIIIIAMAYYIYKGQKDARTNSENWRQTRENQIRAEEHQTGTMQELVKSQVMVVDGMNSISTQIKTLSVMIDERIPKKS